MSDPRITVKEFDVTFAKPCEKCKGTKGRGRTEHRLGFMFRDAWTCACGHVVYSWEWGSTMLAAQACRALSDVGSLAQVPTPAPIFEPTVQPRASKEQMRLW